MCGTPCSASPICTCASALMAPSSGSTSCKGWTPMWADHLTGVADILASTSDGGEVLVNLGDIRDNSGIAAEAPMWGVDGFVSRPNDPDEAGACEALYVVDGDEKRVLATRDMRFSEQVGTLQPGDRAIFTDGEPRLLVKKAKN